MGVTDSQTQKLVGAWPLKGCGGAAGLGFDPKNHRLFSACDNEVMAVTDSESGKVVTTSPIGAGADGAAFDPATGYAFASNGEDGTLTIAHLDSPNKPTVVQALKPAVAGRAMVPAPVAHTI